MSGSNCKNGNILPTTRNSTPNAEGGNRNSLFLDSSFDMMIDRDAGPDVGEGRMCLYDLSEFEVQGGKEVADTDKGIDAVQSTSDHTQTSMRSQDEADKDPTGTKDVKIATSTEETDMGVMVNDKNLEAKDDMLLRSDTNKGIDAVTRASDHTQTSLRCQNGADKDPTGPEDLNLTTFTEENDIGMMVNDDNLKPEVGMLIKCDSNKGCDVVQGSSDHSETSLQCQDGADKDPTGAGDLKISAFTGETDIGMMVNDNNLAAKDDMLSGRDSDRGINAVQGTSDHSETNLRGQDGADKDPTGTKDLEIATFSEKTNIGMLVNDYNFEGKDHILLECEKVPLADPSNSLPRVLCPELGKKGGNMSNVYIQLQNAGRSNKKHDVDWSSPYADKGACFIDSQEELAGETKKMLKKEHPDTRDEANSSAKRLKSLEPLSAKEIVGYSRGPYMCKTVKLEPVDLLDIPSSVTESLTCLAMMDGRPHLELPAKLPGITYRKGMDRKPVLLQDQEKRFWPALYYYRSGFHILTGSWDMFNKEHHIQPGDHYIIEAENVYQGIYQVRILHQ